MSNDKTVNDTELHAYLDKQLDAAQRNEIEKLLCNDEQAQAKLNNYQHLNHSLHRLYDPVLEEAIPPGLLATVSHRSRYWNLVASVVLFLAGSLFGWQAQLHLADMKARPSETDMNLVKPAAFAHVVYSSEVAHPVEVSASQHEHLNKWLSKRLNTKLTAPDLTASGYHLVGGRLLPSTEERMAAQYMYENSAGSRVTLYVRRGDWEHKTQTISYSEQNGLSMFYWTDNDMGYALTSNARKDIQQDMARDAYTQLIINSVKI